MERKTAIFIAVIAIIAIAIAMCLSLVASSFPDGLEKVAERLGFIENAREIMPESSFPVPDYGLRGLQNEYLATSLAGLVGVLIILALFTVIYLINRASDRKNRQLQ